VGRYVTAQGAIRSTLVKVADPVVQLVLRNAVGRVAHVASVVVDAVVVALHTTGTPAAAVGECGTWVRGPER
jgi:hypothetical protein